MVVRSFRLLCLLDRSLVAHSRMGIVIRNGLLIFASVIVYVRSTVGYAVLPLIGAVLALLAWKAPDGVNRFTLQFLGVLGALSMVADFDYLFSEEAVIGGREIPSDTGLIEDALLLPHWVWAIVILSISLASILASLKYALSDKRRLPPSAKLPANVLQFKRKP